jgi:hypothetical protein
MKTEYKLTGKITQERIDELLRIHKTKGLTAETLLEKAKNKKSSLHELFEWNNNKAGEKWRLAQARWIINEVRVIIETEEIPAFEVITTVECNDSQNSSLLLKENNKAYEPIVEILTDKEKRKQLVDKALLWITYWSKRYEQLEELKPIFEAIKKTRKKLNY